MCRFAVEIRLRSLRAVNGKIPALNCKPYFFGSTPMRCSVRHDGFASRFTSRIKCRDSFAVSNELAPVLLHTDFDDLS